MLSFYNWNLQENVDYPSKRRDLSVVSDGSHLFSHQQACCLLWVFRSPYQVEQVLFLELLIFFNTERMLAFYQIIFSMPVEVIFFLSRSVKRSQIFTFKSESYFLSFQNFIVHVRVLIKSTLHSLLSNSSHPPHNPSPSIPITCSLL